MKTAANIALALALLVAALPTSPQSNDSGPYRVFNWLQEAEADLQREGYRPLSRPEGGVLRPGQWASQRLTLRSGHEYQIIGMCDENCADLDMSLYTSAGELLSTDSAPDDVPLLVYSPPATGEYVVRINMRECAREACVFGTHVLVR
jgi:hypothetical protein